MENLASAQVISNPFRKLLYSSTGRGENNTARLRRESLEKVAERPETEGAEGEKLELIRAVLGEKKILDSERRAINADLVSQGGGKHPLDERSDLAVHEKIQVATSRHSELNPLDQRYVCTGLVSLQSNLGGVRVLMCSDTEDCGLKNFQEVIT